MLATLRRFLRLVWGRPIRGPSTNHRRTVGEVVATATMTAGNIINCYAPNTLIMPFSTYIRLGRLMMPKRKWRRWRGKTRAAARSWQPGAPQHDHHSG